MCWFKPTRGEGGRAFGDSVSCLSTDEDWAPIRNAFFLWLADLTLLAGDFAPVFEDYPEGAGP